MLTSDVPEPRSVLSENSTRLVPLVPVQQPLSAQEIERMSKAFIKLLLAKETSPHGHSNQTSTNL